MTRFVHEVTTQLGIPGVFNEFVENPRFPMIVDLSRLEEFEMRWKNAKREYWWQKARQEYFDSIWEAKYRLLVEYKNQHGHVNVPQDHCFLGEWVHTQRQRRGMTDEREARLNSIGFVWNADDAAWEAKYRLLVEYKNQHSHVNVHRDSPLGEWVNNQRQRRGMTDEREARLNSIGFVWKLREAAWYENYYELVEFHRLHSHTKVLSAPGLGFWVKNQRKRVPAEHTDHWIKLNLLRFWDD